MTYYEIAGACLQETLSSLGTPGRIAPEHQAMWNLNNALWHLVQALETDLGALKRQLETLQERVEHLRHTR